MQVLYKYPPDQPVISDVAAFCFPHGVQPMLLERTPSMSSLNQLIYSQRFQQSDDSSFIFLLKVPPPPLPPLTHSSFIGFALAAVGGFRVASCQRRQEC